MNERPFKIVRFRDSDAYVIAGVFDIAFIPASMARQQDIIDRAEKALRALIVPQGPELCDRLEIRFGLEVVKVWTK